MNGKDTEMLMQSIINDNNDIQVIENFRNIELELNESYYDYELLKVALDNKRATIAHFLLNKDCRISNPNKRYLEETPLHLAMKLEDLSVISTIISKNASIYDKNLKGDTPLHLAFKERYYGAVDAVLDYISNCNLNFNPNNKDDILHFHIACIRKHINCVKLYLSFGFDVNRYLTVDSAEFYNLTPLHYLIISHNSNSDNSDNDNTGLFKILLDHSDLSVKNGYGLTPLHYIYHVNHDNCQFDNRKLVAQVFECGNDSKFINAVDKHGVSHFHLCCSTNFPDFVKVFIDKGVDINNSISLNCSFHPGFTPLHFAAKYADVEIVKLLLKNGADCNRPDKEGATPLHVACENIECIEDVNVIETLLDYSACPVVTDKSGNTPLHLAFHNILHTTNFGATVLDKLISKVPLKVNNITDKYGLSLLHIFCSRNYPDRVNNFLNSGAIIDSCVLRSTNFINFSGYSALHFAVAFNQKAVVEVLLKKGAEININRPTYLDTPLHLACESTELKFHDLKREYMMKIETDDEAITLDWILNRRNHLNIIELLLLYGADVNAKNSRGYTPLLAAYNINLGDLLDTSEFFTNMVHSEINIRLLAITNILISNKANINACTNDEGHSIFHLISLNYLVNISDDIMESLITAGANINKTDKNGLTPLHFAAQREKQDELVKIFVRFKANVNAKCQ